MMKPLLLTFDVEEFDWRVLGGRRLPKSQQIAITATGLSYILDLLDRHGVRATFFVTGAFASERPENVEEIARRAHEVAVHGLDHQDDYAAFSDREAGARLRTAYEIVSGCCDREIYGMRTPRLRRCSPSVVRAQGFEYDASPHPTWVPGRYNGLRLPRRPWMEEGVAMVPLSVTPGLRIPVSWWWFQLMGPGIGIRSLDRALVGAPYLHVLFHPWEAVELSRFGASALLSRRTGPPFLETLDRILEWSRNVLAPTTVHEVAKGAIGP